MGGEASRRALLHVHVWPPLSENTHTHTNRDEMRERERPSSRRRRREGSEHKCKGEAEGEGNGWKVVKVVRREQNGAEMERRSDSLRKGRGEKVAVRTKKPEREEKRKMISGRRSAALFIKTCERDISASPQIKT